MAESNKSPQSPDRPGPPTAEPEPGVERPIALYREQPLPVERARLWYPVDGEPPGEENGAYLLFIEAGVLTEVVHRLAADPRADHLGFLTGQLYRCPLTDTRYLAIDDLVPAQEPAFGDRTLLNVAMAWPRLQVRLREEGRHALGWYHTHPGGQLELSSGDVSTHLRFFPQPWQIALLLTPGGQAPEAVVCQPDRARGLRASRMPFYELFESPEALKAGSGAGIRWVGYRSEGEVDDELARELSGESAVADEEAEPVAEADPAEEVEEAASADSEPEAPGTGGGPRDGARESESRDAPFGRPPRAVSPRSASAGPVNGGEYRVVLPAELQAAFDREDDDIPPGFGRRSRRFRPRSRLGIVAGVVALLLIGGLAAWKLVIAPADSEIIGEITPSPGTESPAIDAGPSAFDLAAEEVEGTVSGYRERARLFANQRMTCEDLGRGLVQVEDSWTEYNVQKRGRSAPLSPELETRDRELYQQVQEVERDFVASGCPRP